jgi:hypothetical protein
VGDTGVRRGGAGKCGDADRARSPAERRDAELSALGGEGPGRAPPIRGCRRRTASPSTRRWCGTASRPRCTCSLADPTGSGSRSAIRRSLSGPCCSPGGCGPTGGSRGRHPSRSRMAPVPASLAAHRRLSSSRQGAKAPRRQGAKDAESAGVGIGNALAASASHSPRSRHRRIERVTRVWMPSRHSGRFTFPHSALPAQRTNR